MEDRPTIGAWIDRYGQHEALKWLEMQFTMLFAMSSQSDAGMVKVIKPFCKTFLTQVMPYKTTEVYLFFAMYSTGRLDKSFSPFDVRRIGASFFDAFVPYRNMLIDDAESKAKIARKIQYEKEYSEMLKRIPLGMTMRQWTIHMIESGLLGNTKAQEMIEKEFKQPFNKILSQYED